ncbi:MAG TPA: hypothetical protein VEM15_04930, partial [Thermodesulfobacteriota bacterium]|nr:hypothetical protein [Thermodesulfobacteriota bacterium]
MKKFFSVVMATGLTLLFIAILAQAEPVQKVIPYSKKVPISFFKIAYRFSLWDAETGGNELWSEEKELKERGGLLTTDLGDTVPLDSVDFSQQLYVQVEREVRGNFILIGTRDTFYIAPYAIWAASPAGPKGDTGATGATGPQGPAGAQGP